MISNRQIKLLTSLGKKKYREAHQLFVAETPKVLSEFIASTLQVEDVFTTDPLEANKPHHTLITEQELKKISFLSHPNTCLGLFKIPQSTLQPLQGLTLVLDGVRDPGNLGTIIRLCDWYGINQIVCSIDTVDCFNPKVVQATMGSLTRVRVVYMELDSFLKQNTLPVYGGLLEGENIYSTTIVKDALLIVGNEGQGISGEVLPFITHKVTIPKFGTIQATESLNVATATAILVSEYKRSFTER